MTGREKQRKENVLWDTTAVVPPLNCGQVLPNFAKCGVPLFALEHIQEIG